MAEAHKNIFKKNAKPRRCMYCVRQDKYVDYKNLRLLLKHLSTFARILPRRYTGTCVHHQKMVANAIKNARLVGLLPFTTHHKQYNKE